MKLWVIAKPYIAASGSSLPYLKSPVDIGTEIEGLPHFFEDFLDQVFLAVPGNTPAKIRKAIAVFFALHHVYFWCGV
jgi:hypothetical protein